MVPARSVDLDDPLFAAALIEQDYPFSCPHCGVPLSARLDPSGGRRQQFIQDCEVCCRPIQIRVRFEGEEAADFSAEAAE